LCSALAPQRLNYLLLPPVGGPCRRPQMPLTVCRVLPAAGTSLHGWPLAAVNFGQWLADPLWLLGCACSCSVTAPTSQLQHRPCGTQDGAVTTSVTPATLPSTLRTRANHSELILQPSKAVQSVARWGACAGGGPGPLPAVQQAVPRCDLGAG
jgi:hypothetical protein